MRSVSAGKRVGVDPTSDGYQVKLDGFPVGITINSATKATDITTWLLFALDDIEKIIVAQRKRK